MVVARSDGGRYFSMRHKDLASGPSYTHENKSYKKKYLLFRLSMWALLQELDIKIRFFTY